MKYHYQFVSKTTVRIELIPEDQKETAMLDNLSSAYQNNPAIEELYIAGLSNYSAGCKLAKKKFMNFPTVALCSFTADTKEKILDPLA